MLFKRGPRSYLAILKTKSKAFLTAAFCIDDLFLLLKKNYFKSNKRILIQKATVNKALNLILGFAK